jgi:hypothetical protein
MRKPSLGIARPPSRATRTLRRRWKDCQNEARFGGASASPHPTRPSPAACDGRPFRRPAAGRPSPAGGRRKGRRPYSVPATGCDKFFPSQKRRAPSETRASLRGQGKFRRRRPDCRSRRAAAPAVPVSC